MENPAKNRPTPSNKKGFLKWGIIGVFCLGVGGFIFLDLGRFITLESLKANKEALAAFTASHYPMTVVLFVIIYCIQTALSLPGATILTLAGGFLFGAALGTVYVNIAATTGAVLAFLAARYLFRDVFERRFGKRLVVIEKGVAQNGFHYLLTLRLIPLFPFFLVNVAAGLTRMRLPVYLAATAVGIVPGSFVYANAGKQLGAINSARDVVSPGVLGALVLLGMLALVPVIYRKRAKRTTIGVPPPAVKPFAEANDPRVK
jgi:uncharacterized membrane protein YdjX (TVP38/TMEM64 family)